MSGPEDFISYADYAGLNEGEGQRMLEEAMKRQLTGDASPEQIQQNAMNQYYAGGQEGSGFDDYGKRVQQGMASYGEFVEAMRDPAKRQALLEKVYGGWATGLDSSLVGGQTGGLRQNLHNFANGIDQLQGRALEHKKLWDNDRAAYAQQKYFYDQDQAKKKARRDAEARVRAHADSIGLGDRPGHSLTAEFMPGSSYSFKQQYWDPVTRDVRWDDYERDMDAQRWAGVKKDNENEKAGRKANPGPFGW